MATKKKKLEDPHAGKKFQAGRARPNPAAKKTAVKKKAAVKDNNEGLQAWERGLEIDTES